jgi:polysaccharide export outer membrane protein
MGVTRRGRFPFPSALQLLLLLAAPACTTVHPYYDYANEPDPRKQSYVLGPADVVHISVWKNAELTVDTVVRPDMTISMPLLGDIRAGGRTTDEVRADISRKLTTFVKDESAVVTVSVGAVNSYRFVVSGNVEKGGLFLSTHFVTVTEAMALAGGPNHFASPEDTVIIRSDPKRGLKRIPIDYPAVLNGTHPEQDLPLFSGDTIFVP